MLIEVTVAGRAASTEVIVTADVKVRLEAVSSYVPGASNSVSPPLAVFIAAFSSAVVETRMITPHYPA